RVVAVKIIHPHLSGDREFVRRFEEEAAAVAQLRHPNIIQVYDFSHDGTTYFIVFEYIPGESLQAWLKRLDETGRQMDYKEAAALAAGVADALDYAHEKSLIHRDVKPANVMINVRGQPILMDFGIAKIVGGTHHTATGAVLGTARYMSPEQIRGQRIDARTDIYSLGVMLFEMVSGRAPFEAESAMTLMMMHVQDPVPDLGQLRPDVPFELTQIINKALSKDPADRFATAGELAAALRQVDLTGTAVPATSSPPPSSKPVVPEAAKPTAVAAQPSSGRKPLPKWLYAAGGALLILALLFLAWTQFFNSPGGGDSGAEMTQVAALGGTESAETPSPVSGETAVSSTATSPPVATEAAPGTANQAAQPTNTPRPSPTSLPEVIITNITSENGVYVVDYETIGYVPQTDRLHLHLFYNTTSIENAGRPGSGPYTMIDHPAPSLDFPVDEKPAGATQICALVANPDHTIQLESGNCFDLPQPEATPTVTAVPQPTATSGPRVQITSVTEDNGRYVINFQTFGYTPTLPGTHVHFFFNTVAPEEAGVPGGGPWKLYGGPSPFTEWTVAERPAEATQMCALVANPDHSIQLGTGNCVNLP
ncbi:MAG: protein kinase, partial [Anaerolineae bacterium]